MALTALLGQLPWAWRIAMGAVAVLVIGGAFGAGMKKGFDAGHAAAQAAGEAAYAALERDYARRHVEALAEHAAALRKEAEKSLHAGAALAKAKEEHATIYADLRERIAAVSHGNTHYFSPEFVRLFNDAVGAAAVAPGISSGTTPDPAGTVAAAGTSVAARTGVRPGARVRGGEGRVTERDVLAYIIYYGRRCRDMEAQLGALIQLVGGTE